MTKWNDSFVQAQLFLLLNSRCQRGDGWHKSMLTQHLLTQHFQRSDKNWTLARATGRDRQTQRETVRVNHVTFSPNPLIGETCPGGLCFTLHANRLSHPPLFIQEGTCGHMWSELCYAMLWHWESMRYEALPCQLLDPIIQLRKLGRMPLFLLPRAHHSLHSTASA